ncbi:MAG: class E sortase [Candidatus Phosphoribacter sp.]
MRVLRAVIGGVGELLVTAGVLVLLFVVWQVGYTSLIDARAQQSLAGDLEHQTTAGADDPTLGLPDIGVDPTASPSATQPTLDDGRVFAIIRVPRFGEGWARAVYEGVRLDTLRGGPGHYPKTALPGEIGNMSIAGHRTTYGHPFYDLDQVQPGDVIVIETRKAYVIYRAESTRIVKPRQVEVIAAVPGKPNATPTEAWLTLTTCNPKFSDRERFVLHAKLDRVVPREQGPPPELTAPLGGA